MRHQSVVHLGRSCNYDEGHAEVVSCLALQLFDSAKQIGLHNLGDAERELLMYAATLHDVGDFLSFNDHHLHSQYIIQNAELLGFDHIEIQVIANIARFHRKKLPTRKALKSLQLDDKEKVTVVVLSAFLRFAEKLDRSHCGLVDKVEFVKAGKDQVQLLFYSESDCSFEEWSIIQNKQAFFDAFDKQLEVKCVILQNCNVKE
jgi:exopolyphosphatase/guanosine-5'-triphosphate,3'-diphosphate pyrophosphatase